MKNTAAVIVFFFLTLFVYTKLVGPIPFSVTSTTTTKTDTFSVTGEGKATASPDIASVGLNGSYLNFQNYLKAMENSLRIFDVVGISFSGVGPGQIGARTDNLEFNLIVNTYFQ